MVVESCQGAEDREKSVPDLLGRPCSGRREEGADFLAGADSEAGAMPIFSPFSRQFLGHEAEPGQSILDSAPYVSKFLELPIRWHEIICQL